MKYLKQKKYLITNFQKLNYPLGSKIVFIDEYLFNLYPKKIRKMYKCSYIHSLASSKKIFNISGLILKKKITFYRNKIIKFLNKYQKKKYSKKYWGLIIDQFLSKLLLSIIVETKLLTKIKKKKFVYDFFLFNERYFSNTLEFIRYSEDSNEYRKFLDFLILKKLKFHNINFKINIKNQSTKFIKSNTKIFFLLLNKIIKFYIYLFKPVVISDGYLGLKNTIRIFVQSFGRIINIPSKILLDSNNNNFITDKEFRKTICIDEKDLIDRIFNMVIKYYLPKSFLESFSFFNYKLKKISKFITTIGTGNLHQYNDYFNILAAEIMNKKKGKLLIFQHGSYTLKNDLLGSEHIDNYASKIYYFNDRRGLGQHSFVNLKKISSRDLKKRNHILILDTIKNSERSHNGVQEFTHQHLNPLYLFFSKLNDKTKEKISIKLFPQKKSFEIQKIWTNKFGTKLNFVPFFSSAKKKKFYNSKLVILNDVSTPLWEILYMKQPFILIYNTKKIIDIKSTLLKKLESLKKINILFNNPSSAAKFINYMDSNDYIEEWWHKISHNNIYLDFKQFLLTENKFYYKNIINDLIKKNA